MNFIKMLERIRKTHKLIKGRRTGTPDEFAKRLGISKRQLFTMLDFLKHQDAPIRFDRHRKSYYYHSEDFDIEINFSVKSLSPDKEQKTSGGYFQNNCPM